MRWRNPRNAPLSHHEEHEKQKTARTAETAKVRSIRENLDSLQIGESKAGFRENLHGDLGKSTADGGASMVMGVEDRVMEVEGTQ